MIACAFVAIAVIGVAGCGEAKPERFPVTGKVTIGGKAAEEGAVVFNSGMTRLVGVIMPDGSYSIMDRRDPGAPPGKYKVTVMVSTTPKDASGNPVDLPKTISNPRFMNPASTPFEVEVVESPSAGAYDFAVTR